MAGQIAHTAGMAAIIDALKALVFAAKSPSLTEYDRMILSQSVEQAERVLHTPDDRVQRKAKYSFDPACLELVNHFLSDEPWLQPLADDCAALVQTTIEDWITYDPDAKLARFKAIGENS